MFFEPHTTSYMRTPSVALQIKNYYCILKSTHSNRYLYFCRVFKTELERLKISTAYCRIYTTASTKCTFVWFQAVSAAREGSYSKDALEPRCQRWPLQPFLYLLDFVTFLLPLACLSFNIKYRVFCALLTVKQFYLLVILCSWILNENTK